jgi:casein kinase II subunit alpha
VGSSDGRDPYFPSTPLSKPSQPSDSNNRNRSHDANCHICDIDLCTEIASKMSKSALRIMSRRPNSSGPGHTTTLIGGRYKLGPRIASGRTADVHHVQDVTQPSPPLVAKIYYSERSNFARREAEILKALGGKTHIIPLVAEDLRVQTSQMEARTVLIFPRIQNIVQKRAMFNSGNIPLIRKAAHQLCQALAYAHSLKIIHRDVKPDNMLVSMVPRIQLSLIDWGLAEYDYGQQFLSCNVGCRAYKAPELLLGSLKYTNKVDCWSVGVLFLGLMSRREVYFRGVDDSQQLVAIADAVGSRALLESAVRQELSISPSLQSLLHLQHPIGKLGKLASQASPEGRLLLDLAMRLTKVDPIERISMAEALQHPFFYPLRRLDADLSSIVEPIEFVHKF